VDFHNWWHNPLRRVGLLPDNFSGNKSYTRKELRSLLESSGVGPFQTRPFVQELDPLHAPGKFLRDSSPHSPDGASSGRERATFASGCLTVARTQNMRILVAHNAYQKRGGEDSVVEAETRMLQAHGHSIVRHERHNDELRSRSPLATWQPRLRRSGPPDHFAM